ncbi:MAG: substrate-binding domain-containing protein, partial [Gemmatimonadota bacterium]
MIITRTAYRAFGAGAATLLVLSACGGEAGEGGLTGTITIDGSSTVYPVSEAMAEEFSILNPGVRPNVTYSGTGGGFKRFCAGETEISNASRAITEEELALCEGNGVDYLEIPVALDGLAVVTN